MTDKHKHCKGCECETHLMTEAEHRQLADDLLQLIEKYIEKSINFREIAIRIISMAVMDRLVYDGKITISAIRDINLAVGLGMELFDDFSKKEQSND